MDDTLKGYVKAFEAGPVAAAAKPAPPADPHVIISMDDNGAGKIRVTLQGTPNPPVAANAIITVSGNSNAAYNKAHTVRLASSGPALNLTTASQGSGTNGQWV